MSLDTVQDVRRDHEERYHHVLALRDENLNAIGEAKNCNLCNRPVGGGGGGDGGPLFYVCDACDGYVLHKSCGDLPLKIDAPVFHDYHGPFISLVVQSWRCDSCLELIKKAPSYTCPKCYFCIDAKCATTPRLAAVMSEEGKKLKHRSHSHSLSLVVERSGEVIIKCSACEEAELSGDPVYGCAPCGFFLHASCTAFPDRVVCHPLHMHLHLNLNFDAKSFTCGICETTKYAPHNFNFMCDNHCGFRVCWRCVMSVKRNIEYEDHAHTLCFVEKIGKKNNLSRCNGYDAYCTRPELGSDGNIIDIPEELKRTESSVFRCVVCDFRLHLLCGPLPSTIKHECHIHALTLIDSLVEDDSGEYYCDVCETERDPRLRLYYCEECKYSAHVHCVISEIVNVLRGELKGVELMPLGTWTLAAKDKVEYRSTSLTLKWVIDKSMRGDEKSILNRWYEWDGNHLLQPPKGFSIGDEEINDTVRLARFTDQEFLKFCTDAEYYCRRERLVLSSSELGLTLVEVKGYEIPRPLAAEVATLLDEHEDLVADSHRLRSMSSSLKSFALFILCMVVKRMRATLVKDVTKNLLREWYHHLRFVKYMGFNIGFALARFESLVDAFLGLQSERLEDEIPARLKAKMAETQQGLEMCDEYRSSSSERSEYMKFCLKRGSESRWHNAFDVRIGPSSSVPRQQWKWRTFLR